MGDTFAGEQQFRGRSTDRQQVNVPMSYIAEKEGTQNLVLSKEGTGRLYYRIGMSYAPTNLKLKPADNGFTVERVYEAIENPADVRRDADGTWHIKSGATRARAPDDGRARAQVSRRARGPAAGGFGGDEPGARRHGRHPRGPEGRPSKRGGWWWWQNWFEHQNLRDERAEAFTSLLWEGVYNYSYVARATTPGTFVVPPTKAEEMYHPETFGRSASDKVVVE